MTVKFTATKLLGTGKKGVLTPDADGYYTMVIGALNCFNSAGEYYRLKGAEMLFQESSVFMRRVRTGCLKAEVGHPKKGPGMSYKEYVNRIFQIEETNICAHFKEIWLDPNYGAGVKGATPGLTAIMAKVRPAGVKGQALKEAFESGAENVCFSIRALTRDHYENGKCVRVLDSIVTFDWVNEPGIQYANKWDSPALESMNDVVLVKETIESLANDTRGVLAMEDSSQLIQHALNAFKEPMAKKHPPNYHSW